MITVTIAQAEANLESLVDAAARGEAVFLVNDDGRKFELRPLTEDEKRRIAKAADLCE